MIIIAGAIVGIVVVGGHENYSDYSDHYSDHSQYSDAWAIQQIESAKSERNSLQRRLNRARSDYQSYLDDQVSNLRNDYKECSDMGGVSDSSSLNARKNEVISKLEKEVNDDIKTDQEALKQIDAALERINTLKLKH